MATPKKKKEVSSFPVTEDGFDVIDQGRTVAQRTVIGDTITIFRVPISHEPVRVDVEYEGESGIGITRGWISTSVMRSGTVEGPDPRSRREVPFTTPVSRWWIEEPNARFVEVETELPPGAVATGNGKEFLPRHCVCRVLLIGKRR